MAEQAAHLVDQVLPHISLRQSMLTLPYRLRSLLAYDHALCRERLTRQCGTRRSGAVTVIQRFAGGLYLDVH